MKSLLLASGKGSRLSPLTDNFNKHLIPINGKPMIVHVITKIIESGINEIVVVYNNLGRDIPNMVEKFFSAKNAVFKFVSDPDINKGVPNSMKYAKELIGDSDFMLAFGDVIFEKPQKEYINNFYKSGLDCKLLLGYSNSPQNHASVYFEKGNIKKIVEKDSSSPNNVIVTTYDIYTPKLWKCFDYLEVSSRGEYEITDVRNYMLMNFRVGYSFVDGDWVDARTFEGLKKAETLV